MFNLLKRHVQCAVLWIAVVLAPPVSANADACIAQPTYDCVLKMTTVSALAQDYTPIAIANLVRIARLQETFDKEGAAATTALLFDELNRRQPDITEQMLSLTIPDGRSGTVFDAYLPETRNSAVVRAQADRLVEFATQARGNDRVRLFDRALENYAKLGDDAALQAHIEHGSGNFSIAFSRAEHAAKTQEWDALTELLR